MTVFSAFVGRGVKRFTRRADVIVSTVIFPLLLLLTLHAVFSQSVESFEGGEAYGQRLVPTLVVSGILFGSMGTATGVFFELRDGWMDRLRSMPINPWAPLAGTVVAEAFRALLAVVTIVAVGYLFDFRFQNGLLSVLAFVVVAAVSAMAISWFGVWVAAGAKSQEAMLGPLNAVFLLLVFLSRGMVPLEAYPGWVQPVVRASPATAYVTLLDRLARGGALVQPFLIALGWTVALTVVFGSLAVRRIRTRGATTAAVSVAAA